MITNSDDIEVQDLGYIDLVKVGQAKIHFARMGHGSKLRTSYFYMQESFHKLPKSKCTFKCKSLDLEVGHPFNNVWQIFNEDCLDLGTKKVKEDCGINGRVLR